MKYQEKMSREELLFLIKKYRKDKSAFVQTFRSIGFIVLLFPGVGGIFMELYHRAHFPDRYQPEDLANAYFYLSYVIGTLIALLVLGLIAYFVYQTSIKKLVLDIKKGEKTIAQTSIIRKTSFQAQSFFFYLESAAVLSIEVSQEDYQQYQKGDEINIEYASHSKVYFGYF